MIFLQRARGGRTRVKTKATVTVEVHTDIPGCHAEDSCSDDSPSNSPDPSSISAQRNKTHKRSDQCHRFSEGDESETSL